MSDLSEIFGTETESGNEPDFAAIFGGGDAADAPPIPVEEPKHTEATAEAAVEEPVRTQDAEESAAPAEVEAQTEPAEAKTPKTRGKKKESEAEQDLFAAFNDQANAPAPPTQQTASASSSGQVSLFDKAPIFSYGSAKEPIEDASITFEDLRIKKSEDFPELESGKTVSWRVKYGAVTKSVADPKESTIAKIKEEIERSKAFLDGLKKAKNDKDRNPDCLVSPVVIAKSKGIAAYAGVFPSVEAARASDKVICILPASDGKIYEMRKNEMGEFIAPKNKIVDFAEVRAGFTPALPPIPHELMGQIIAFFRCFMNEGSEYEAMAFIYWDRQNKEFVAFVPKQRASKASIHAELEDNTLPEERYLHYADIHSHNSMAAKFSATDDADEKATRLYIVIGRLDQFYPDITARVSCGGTYLQIDPHLVMEGVGEEFPSEWLDQVERVGGGLPERRALAARLLDCVWPRGEELDI
ncbi:MAG: Mov34/MPN/PAD-1 family protein [Oscillospiraceae bacterium]|nr:Mov34/MPN/PAD-1 family protein [Oscillospiraceae bacterium]